MLTARDTEMDEVKALETGVADYMSKPFSIAVLKARIRKILQGRKPENRLVSGGIALEKDSCKVYKNGEEIRCSKVEYQLLMYFMENRGQVLSKGTDPGACVGQPGEICGREYPVCEYQETPGQDRR